MQDDYEAVKNALVEAIAEIHPSSEYLASTNGKWIQHDIFDDKL